MNLYQVSLLLLFLNFVSANDSPTPHSTGDVSVNCGSDGTSAARNNKEWLGDVQLQLSSFFKIEGPSFASSVVHKLTYADDPIPYETARLSRSGFSYTFHVNPGQKIIRLHFNPAAYKGFEMFKDLFDVEAGSFTLLSNFSASLIADALRVNSFVKEYCINIEENQQFDIIFTPTISQSLRTYAFINGIEIISVPVILSYFVGVDIGVEVLGKSLVYVDTYTALEIIHRERIKQDETSDMFGMWEKVPDPKRNEINNVTWKISVDVGFRYLVRLYFSEVGVMMAESGGDIFNVSINGMIADTNIDIVCSDENNIGWYRDYMVMMKGSKRQGKRDFLICLQSSDKFMYGRGPLKGFEIMKLSNHDNSLASPNPMPKARESSHRTAQNLLSILGDGNVIALIATAVVALVSTIVYSLRRIHEASCTEEENKPSARAERFCRRFSLAEIDLATGNFSPEYVIGRGGFGKVYRGLIDNGKETVAIKRLKPDSRQGVREFLTEIETLTELRHVNLVSLIGYCNEQWEMILVYEYVACGTLADYLSYSSSLTWNQCLNICIGAGRGLDYLHTSSSLIHRDVKGSNILLDVNFMAKLSDFGLAKHLSRSKLESHVSTKVRGTFGYFDPDYLATGKLTKKSDIYSFGVVLLEVLSGRRAVDKLAEEDERSLTKWARERISNGRAEQIVAPNLRGEISEDSLKTYVDVAARCLHDDPKKRPPMAEVVLLLESALQQQDSSKSMLTPGKTHPDGKEYIRQVRMRLTYEQFRSFLENLRLLNSHKQTVEETLRNVAEIFGPNNRDLYIGFQGLRQA